jgi:hypothetical protein
MIQQPHKHLEGCMNNKTIQACCVACKWQNWTNAKHHISVVGTSFAQQLTPSDEELLRKMKISWKQEPA